MKKRSQLYFCLHQRQTRRETFLHTTQKINTFTTSVNGHRATARFAWFCLQLIGFPVVSQKTATTMSRAHLWALGAFTDERSARFDPRWR